MSNRIVDVIVENGRLDPLQAEVLVHVRPERLTPTTEVRGRLMGPSCPYSTTLEIAHALTSFSRDEPEGWITCKAVIPEASLWDPVSPFIYRGPVELWQDGQRLDRIEVGHGLRRFALTGNGLRVNGKPLALNAESVNGRNATFILGLRARGINVLVTPLDREMIEVCALADHFGFLVALLAGEVFEPIRKPFERALAAHPGCLGLLFRESWLPSMRSNPWRPVPGTFFGALLTRPPEEPLPDAIDFVVAAGDDVERLAACGRPVLFTLP